MGGAPKTKTEGTEKQKPAQDVAPDKVSETGSDKTKIEARVTQLKNAAEIQNDVSAQLTDLFHQLYLGQKPEIAEKEIEKFEAFFDKSGVFYLLGHWIEVEVIDKNNRKFGQLGGGLPVANHLYPLLKSMRLFDTDDARKKEAQEAKSDPLSTLHQQLTKFLQQVVQAVYKDGGTEKMQTFVTDALKIFPENTAELKTKFKDAADFSEKMKASFLAPFQAFAIEGSKNEVEKSARLKFFEEMFNGQLKGSFENVFNNTTANQGPMDLLDLAGMDWESILKGIFESFGGMFEGLAMLTGADAKVIEEKLKDPANQAKDLNALKVEAGKERPPLRLHQEAEFAAREKKLDYDFSDFNLFQFFNALTGMGYKKVEKAAPQKTLMSLAQKDETQKMQPDLENSKVGDLIFVKSTDVMRSGITLDHVYVVKNKEPLEVAHLALSEDKKTVKSETTSLENLVPSDKIFRIHSILTPPASKV